MFARLLELLYPPRADERLVHSAPPDALCARLDPRIVPTHAGDVRVLLSFSDPLVRAAVHEAKYHGSAAAFLLLGSALDAALGETDALLVPVPLARARERERGYNQVEAVLRHSRAGARVAPELIKRTRDTSSQVALSRIERIENMRGAFSPLKEADPSRAYILIDDVVTTGATLEAARSALESAGAKDIRLLALAH